MRRINLLLKRWSSSEASEERRNHNSASIGAVMRQTRRAAERFDHFARRPSERRLQMSEVGGVSNARNAPLSCSCTP